MNKKARLLVLPYLVWMIDFIVIPLALVSVFDLIDQSGASTLDNVTSVVERNHLKALKFSLLLSFASMLIYFLLAFLLVLILRSKRIGRADFVIFTFALPIWINFPPRIPARQTLLEKNGVINGILGTLHLSLIAIINTPAAIVLDMAYNFLPFTVLPLYSIMCKIGDSVVEAARDLGVSPPQTLWCIWFPLSIPGIASGVTMVLVLAFMTFVISNILDSSEILLIGNVIETELTKASNWNLGSGLSIVMLVSIPLSMTVFAHYDKSGEGTVFR